ncbi:Holliday junction resolvase RuvX [Chitinimonas sp. BJB300]|uniref:Holliday junction resolvase RuvX n=1 Tax=Chitinimonas sp. BJB300 TaxID=1559339 RepID=UPI000C0FB366|nr:Holliday junction resolvase RuvX [Chitinimonas sp. BJB300]PHV11779.1 Holliday junction resolvase RuvX [Chitinimonas sp. BJB300]TSJ91223.1 Holliday junction resolvase RuvX [Chitinimonas sp. BJB300]
MSGYVIAFDFGEVRIGVAGGSMELGIATPLATVTGNNNDEKFAAIGKLIAEWQPTQLVVGLPSHLDGTEHELSRLSRTFSNRLHGRFNLPVALVDERLTSAEAEGMLSETQTFGKKRKQAIDQVAAMQILQAWFDGR